MSFFKAHPRPACHHAAPIADGVSRVFTGKRQTLSYGD